ncbi:MAG: ribonuclease P protein component [Mycoplasmoidaceae bacterium]
MNKKYRLNKVLFNDVFKISKVSHSDNFIIKFKNNSEKKARIGISASKKFFKSSVLRNKIKRQIRSILQPIVSQLKSFDLVIIAKKEYDINSYEKQKEELISLIKKNNILN